MAAVHSQSNNSTTGRINNIPRWLKTGLHVADMVAPVTTNKWLRKRYFSPSRLGLREHERSILATGTRFTFKVDGIDVAAHTWGELGPTVWLIHGWAGHLGQLTPMVAPLLKRGYRVAGFDWPAHGESGGTISSLRHARQAMTTLRKMMGSPFGIIAHSFGAAATTLSMIDGLKATRLVFLSPTARVRPYIDRFSCMMGMNDSRKNRFVKASEEWLQAPFDDFEPLNFVTEIAVPLLVDFDEAQQLTTLWNGSILKAIDGVGHRRILKDPDTIQSAIEFLEK
jgi:Alpha/beta hydrolase family